MNIRKRLRAFTLIELLIVITIIGILAVALVPRITGGPAKARDAARKADLQQIATALEFYADDNGGVYPDPSTTGTGDCVSSIDLSSYLTTDIDDPQGSGVGDCGDGYGYYPVNENAAGDYAGYLLVADLENDSAVGDGIYELDDLVAANTVNTDTASDNMGRMDLCSTDAASTCSSNGAMYVVGR